MAKTVPESPKDRLNTIRQERDPMYNTNRRIRAKRLHVSFPVQITHKGSPVHGYAEAKNISFSGMLLMTNFPMDTRDPFTLEFTLPNHDIPIQTKVRVVRSIDGATHDEPTTVAVVFVDIDPNVSKLISGFFLENISTY